MCPVCLIAQSCLTLCDPRDCGPMCLWGFSRQEHWSGLPWPPPGDLPKPGLLHCRQILYRLSYQGSLRILEWVAFPFSRDLLNPGIESRSPTLQVDSLPAEPHGKSGYQIRTVFRASTFKRMMCYFKTSVMGIPWWSSG